MGKLTISMAMFNSYVSHYQRVWPSCKSWDLRFRILGSGKKPPLGWARRPTYLTKQKTSQESQLANLHRVMTDVPIEHHPTIRYMVNAMATFFGDVQYSQNGTVTNPWISTVNYCCSSTKRLAQLQSLNNKGWWPACGKSNPASVVFAANLHYAQTADLHQQMRCPSQAGKDDLFTLW